MDNHKLIENIFNIIIKISSYLQKLLLDYQILRQFTSDGSCGHIFITAFVVKFSTTAVAVVINMKIKSTNN